jgi:hypothetical protein
MPAQPLESARGVILLAHNIFSVDVKEATQDNWIEPHHHRHHHQQHESRQELPVVGRRSLDRRRIRRNAAVMLIWRYICPYIFDDHHHRRSTFFQPSLNRSEWAISRPELNFTLAA